MKITDMLITPVAFRDPPLRNPTGVHVPWALRAIVRLRTDDGYEGLGKTGGKPATVEHLEAARQAAVGEDPFQIERIRQKVPNPEIMCAVDHACLDIMGKVASRPVCDILGGRVRDEVEFASYLFFKFGADDEYGEVLGPQALLELAKLFHERHGFRVSRSRPVCSRSTRTSRQCAYSNNTSGTTIW